MSDSQNLFQQALSHHQAGRLNDAETLYRQILAAESNHADALHLLGLSHHQRGQSSAAVPYIEQAIAIDGNKALYQNNLAAVYTACQDGVKAEQAAQRALALKPSAEAWQNLGIALHLQNRFHDAIGAYQHAIQLKPSYAEAHFNLGNAWRELQQMSDAAAAYRQALQQRPQYPLAANNLGSALALLGDLAGALAAYQQALQGNASDAGVYNNIGNTLRSLGRLTEAQDAYRKALDLQADNAEAHYSLGNIHRDQGKLDLACAAYQAALHIEPEHWPAFSQDLHTRQMMCDWAQWNERGHHLIQAVANNKTGGDVEPFILLSLPATLEVQQRCAQQRAAKRFAPLAPAVAHKYKPRLASKLRIGYLSGDFHAHATAYLMAELFELHDRKQFEVFAYSYSRDDNSPIRARLKAAFDKFVDIREDDYASAAARIRDDKIQLLIDLKGYTQHNRLGILAHRPAPIQAHFVGYPGTLGTSFVDYLVADPFIVPPEHLPLYSEKIAGLPFCYQPNDRQRPVGQMPSRVAAGLPEHGLVLCCFNQTYKIVPWMYDAWMRILQAVPNSVLWLLDCNSWAKDNLKREAQLRGVDAARLVFAPKLPLAEHLARFGHADIFLDTLPYNAHTTMSDALWVGVPAVTCSGPTFAARVGGSLLRAVGLAEWVTENLQDYQQRVIHLAHNPTELKALRDTLASNRLATPLFNTPLFTNALEALYKGMWTRYEQGLPPEHMQLRANR